MWTSGPHPRCANAECTSDEAPRVGIERWDAVAKIVTGTQLCTTCFTTHGFSRKPTKAELNAGYADMQVIYDRTAREDAPRSTIDTPPDPTHTPISRKDAPMHPDTETETDTRTAAPDTDPVGRVTTFPANGSAPTSTEPAPPEVTIGEAMRQAVIALGDITIDPEQAVAQLRDLAEGYDQVTRMQAAYDRKNDDAKIAKKALESATDLLLEKVRACTHQKPLPLFDASAEATAVEAMTTGEAVPAGDDDAARVLPMRHGRGPKKSDEAQA